MVSTQEAPSPRPNLQPVPEEWNARSMVMDPAQEFPVERVEVRDDHRGPKAWIEYLAIRLAEQTVGRLPRAILNPILGGFARTASLFDRRHAAAARTYLRAALPEASAAEHRRLALEAWKHLARVALAAPRLGQRLVGQPLGEFFDVRLSPEAKAVAEAGEGCVLVTAHVGNWEAVAPACLALGIGPMYAIGKAPRNDPLSQHMQQTRESTGGRMLPRKGAMKGAPAVIRAGGCVMMLLDHRARQKPVWAPFFGRPAACDRSAGVLLRRIGAPIVFIGCYERQDGRRFQLDLGTVLRPEDLSGLSPEQVATRINQELEQLILACPEQYFWLHDRYKDAPLPGAATHE